jgi:integrase
VYPSVGVRLDVLQLSLVDVIKRCRDSVVSKSMPPTFHELRSLAARLYSEQHSADFSQAIPGHQSASMTAIYRDVRGAEWIEVKLAGPPTAWREMAHRARRWSAGRCESWKSSAALPLR